MPDEGATYVSPTFADLEIGDVFSFADHAGHESWEKTRPYQARVVNSDYTRNVSGGERVNIEYAIAARRARLRESAAREADFS